MNRLKHKTERGINMYYPPNNTYYVPYAYPTDNRIILPPIGGGTFPNFPPFGGGGGFPPFSDGPQGGPPAPPPFDGPNPKFLVTVTPRSLSKIDRELD